MNRLAAGEVDTYQRGPSVGTRDEREHTGVLRISHQRRRHVVRTEFGEILLRFLVVEHVFSGLTCGEQREEERIVGFFQSIPFERRSVHLRFEVKHIRTIGGNIALIAQAVELFAVDFNLGQLFHLRVELLVSGSRGCTFISGSGGSSGSGGIRCVLSHILAGLHLGGTLFHHLRADRVGHFPIGVGSVGVGAVGDLFDRIVLVNDRVTTLSGRAERFFFEEEAERVVLLPRHGGVSRTHLRRLVRTFPVLREVSRRVEISRRREGFVVDTHVRASAGSEGHRLEREIQFLARRALFHRHDHHLAVASVGRSLLQRRVSHTAPLAFARGGVGVAIDVVVASAAHARADQNRTVGQFFRLGFVGAAGHCGDRSLAEHIPRLTEVVGIEHPVRVRGGGRSGASEDHAVNTVVRTHLHAMTLHEATAAEEERFHFSEGRFAFSVEERVDVLRDVLRLRPRRSIVLRIPARNGDRRVARRSEEAHLSRCTEEQHLAALAIGHDGRVAIARIAAAVGVHVVVLAETLCHCVVRCVAKHVRRRPSGPVVGRTRNEEVDAACADIAHSRVARVRHGQDRTVLRRRDGRNAISHLRRVVVHEDVLLRFGLGDRTHHRDIEIREQRRVVRPAEGEFGRIRVVVGRPAEVLSRFARGEGVVAGRHREMLSGSGALRVELKVVDRIARTGRERIVAGQHAVTHISQEVVARSLHVVGHRREAHLRCRLRRRPSIFVGTRALRSQRTLVGAHLHALHRKEHLKAAAVVLSSRPEGETRVAIVHLVAGLAGGIHVDGRFVGTEIGALLELPVDVIAGGHSRCVAKRHERTAAGLSRHGFGGGEHLCRAGRLVIDAVAHFGRTDETPKIFVFERCVGTRKADLAVVSGIGNDESVGRDLQRVPASAGGKFSALDRCGLKRRRKHIGREGTGCAQPESQRKE